MLKHSLNDTLHPDNAGSVQARRGEQPGYFSQRAQRLLDLLSRRTFVTLVYGPSRLKSLGSKCDRMEPDGVKVRQTVPRFGLRESLRMLADGSSRNFRIVVCARLISRCGASMRKAILTSVSQICVAWCCATQPMIPVTGIDNEHQL